MKSLNDVVESKYKDQNKTLGNVKSEMKSTIYEFIIKKVEWDYEPCNIVKFTEDIPKPAGSEFELAIGFIDKTRVKRGSSISKRTTYSFSKNAGDSFKVCYSN